MDKVMINLTLNKETKIVEASVIRYNENWTALRFVGVDVTTSHGGMVHKGMLTFRYTPGRVDYSIKDVTDIRYPGMRGNGYANHSKFRYVGFSN